MATLFTTGFLTDYIKRGKKHKAYKETVDMAEALAIHADGLKPGKLLTERRPSESLERKKYREEIYVPITEPVIGKIITSLSKIRKSQDWSIRYPKGVTERIREGETLYDYCEVNYPFFTSITNWCFNVLLKNYLVDANAIVVVMPLEKVADNDFLRPFSFVYNSDQVIDFVDEDYAVIHSTDKATYVDKGITYDDGDVYLLVNTIEVQRWVQIDRAKTFVMAEQITHNLGRVPAFKTGGVFKKAMDKLFIYKSRLSPIIPRLDEAVREYSDLQAEVVQHVHSEKWVYQGQECKSCNGTGARIVNRKQVECDKCQGLGRMETSPYKHIVVTPPVPGTTGETPIPPAGYIQKQVEIVRIQDERIDRHIYHALSAINMEFLAQVPLSQSGVAKEVDRDELNTFVNSIAEDIVSILDKVYSLVNDYRYNILIPDNDLREQLLPSINVPDRFDLISSSFVADELKKARETKLNPVIINALEMDYAGKKFVANPDIRHELEMVLLLDPVSGISEDDKMLRLQNGGITEDDYIVSSNITAFVRRAMSEEKSFMDMPEQKKLELMARYAAEKQLLINAGNKLSEEALNGGTGPVE